jgi:hypothetical protein
MLAMKPWVITMLIVPLLAACGDLGWRKNGGGTVSQFNDDSYACKLVAQRAASAGVSAVPAPSSDTRSGCTSRGEGLTACAPVPAGSADRPASDADAHAAILEKGWRECMFERGWRETAK